MLKIAFRSACLSLTLALIAAVAQAGSIQIHFADLEEYARTTSIRAQVSDLALQRVRAERDQAVQWSNPEIAYDREDVADAGEYQITAGKRFSMPWAYWQKRSGWNERLKASTLEREQEAFNTIAELRSGYVRLHFLDKYNKTFEKLEAIIAHVSRTASTRHSEGHLSGIENRLIQMATLSLKAEHQAIHRRRQDAAGDWYAAIGIQPADSVVLVTEIAFQQIALQPLSYYADLSRLTPGFRSRSLQQDALGKLAAAERGSFISAINLYGGSKKVGSEGTGYVAGVSLDIPLFNQNGAAARRLKLEQRVAEQETQAFSIWVERRLNALLASINELSENLSTVNSTGDENADVLTDLLNAYEEGWLSLNEFLSALEIEMDGVKSHTDQVILYYENLFELEAITGTTLVTFAR